LNDTKEINGQVWWVTLVIPVLQKLRQEGSEFEDTLGYIASSRSAWATQ
jgi:hypothetical protein